MSNKRHISQMMRVLLVLFTYQLSFITAHAQVDPEYRLELGAGLGMVNYEGDFNGSILKNPMPMFSAVAKYRFNPRMALAMNVSYGRIKGESKNVNTYYPQFRDYQFNHGILDVGMRYEYNFWPYGTGFEYRGARRLTPYIYIGLGLTVGQPDKTEVGLNFPIGGGVKYKMADRMNVALEWTMHFTTNDRLDGVKDPYAIESSGMFKNKDCYSHLRLSLTYDLWAKCKVCHNDRD